MREPLNKQDKSRALDNLEYKLSGKKPVVAAVRRDLHGMEKPYIWQFALLNADGLRLIMPLRQPYMNYKECRLKLAEILAVKPEKLKVSAVKGGRYFYPNREQMATLTEAAPVESSEKDSESVAV